MKDEKLLERILKDYGVNLYDENKQIKNFMILLDDLFLNNNVADIADLMYDLGTLYFDDVFGGLTDERRN